MGLFNKKPTVDAEPVPPEKKPDEATADKPDDPAPAPAAADTAPPADVPGESDEAASAGAGVAPVGPEAATPGEAPAAAPVAQAAMEVAQMPDDVSSLSDDELRAFLNGVVKFLKSIAPGEATEPAHQPDAAPVVDSVTPEGEGIPPMGDSDDDAMTTDSVIFGMPLGDANKPETSFKDFNTKLFGKGAK